MSTYTLTNTAKEIDDAVQAVTGADNSPQPNSDLMVTSGGVHTAVNNINLTNMASGVITTESDGISNYDTDGNIPTNAAVKDYVDSSTPPIVQTGYTTLAGQQYAQTFYDAGTAGTVSNTAGITYTRPTSGIVTVILEYRVGFPASSGIITEGITFKYVSTRLPMATYYINHVVPANTPFQVYTERTNTYYISVLFKPFAK
jgi:hypothetical protein